MKIYVIKPPRIFRPLLIRIASRKRKKGEIKQTVKP